MLPYPHEQKQHIFVDDNIDDNNNFVISLTVDQLEKPLNIVFKDLFNISNINLKKKNLNVKKYIYTNMFSYIQLTLGLNFA